MAYKLKIGPSQGLKLKGNAGFTLPLLGGTAISTSKSGGIWRVDLDYSEIQTGSTVNDDTAYVLTWDSISGAFTRLNVTDLKVEFEGTFDGYYQPLDATLTALAALDSTSGILAQTGEDTFERRTLTGTANEVTVTNGAGAAGDPTVSLPDALTFTGKTVAGGTFESPAINTPTGIVKSDVGLGNVDNTSDATKDAAAVTLTNKTIDTAGPNTIKVNGNTLAATAGTATVTIPNATDTLVGRDTTDTLANKTLTSPVINSPTGIVKGDVGLGNVDNTSDVTKNAATATLTNKTISGASNTLSNIGNSSLTNSSMTIAGHIVSLGGTQAIAVGDLSSIADGTIASNVSGGSAAPAANSISSVLDKLFGATQGNIVYRDVSEWAALAPGSSGQFLKTLGASANPAWDTIPGGGDMLSTNNLSDVANSDTALDNLGFGAKGKQLSAAATGLIARSAIGAFGSQFQVFTSSGTFTTPAGTTTETVYHYRLQGAGGGGGGITGGGAAGGGGSGAYAEGTFTGLAPGTAISITVGAAGSGGAAGASGTAGGASTIGAPVSITANAGTGGAGGASGSVFLPGAGGAVPSGPDILAIGGCRGEPGVSTISAVIVRGGRGASSLLGAGGEPGMYSIGSNGLLASGYGAGGGAGVGSSGTGGNGSKGIAIIGW